MAFGFDPSLILQSRPVDVISPARSLADMLAQKQSMQLAQNQDARAQMLGQAQVQDMASQRALRDVQTQSAKQSALMQRAAMVGNIMRGVTDQQSLDAAKQALRNAGEPEDHLAMIPDKYEDAKTLIPRLTAFAVSPEEQQKIESGQIALNETKRRQAQLADANSVTSQARMSLANQVGLKVAPGTPGNAIDDQELNYAEKLQAAKESAAARMAAARMMAGYGAGGGGTPGPNPLDPLVEQTALTGTLPPGVSKQPGRLNQFMARLNELHPGTNLAEVKARYDSNKGALDQLEKQAGAVDQFERTSMGNLDNYLALTNKLSDTGSPLLNSPIREFQKKIQGNPDLQSVETARQVAVNEIAKLMSGSLGNAGVPEGQQKEIQSLIPADATLGQIRAAAKVLKQDMGTRKTAIAAARDEIMGRLTGKGAGGNSGPSVKEERTLPDGRTIQLLSDGTKRIKP